MRLFRFLFDSIAFMLPIYKPKLILLIYFCIHLFYPKIVKVPRKLDLIKQMYFYINIYGLQ